MAYWKTVLKDNTIFDFERQCNFVNWTHANTTGGFIKFVSKRDGVETTLALIPSDEIKYILYIQDEEEE